MLGLGYFLDYRAIAFKRRWVSSIPLLGHLYLVFPIPPLQLGWCGISVASVINGTSKGIENAPVDMFPLSLHQPLIQVFGISSLQVANPMNADIIEQKGNSWANARDGCKTFRFHHLVALTLGISGGHLKQRNR